MIGIKRLGRATLSTPDLGRALAYYRDMIGLVVVSQTADQAVLATTQGEEAIVLKAGSGNGLQAMSFLLGPDAELERVAATLKDGGVASEILTDSGPGPSRVLQFQDPDGVTLQVTPEAHFHDRSLAASGIMPERLGHVARITPQVAAYVDFYVGVLGFRKSDWREGAAYFLRCSRDHHTINFFANPTAALHHIAFQLSDWSEMRRACDFLARNGYLMEWGPSRHIMGHNISCYHRDPDGRLVELYTELDVMTDEDLGFFEPRPWHQSVPQRPREWPPGTSSNYWGQHQIVADKKVLDT